MLLNILLLSGLLLHFDQPPKVVDQSAVRVERHFNLMGTTLTISVEALDRRIALSASEEALKVLQKAEKVIAMRPPSGILRVPGVKRGKRMLRTGGHGDLQ